MSPAAAIRDDHRSVAGGESQPGPEPQPEPAERTGVVQAASANTPKVVPQPKDSSAGGRQLGSGPSFAAGRPGRRSRGKPRSRRRWTAAAQRGGQEALVRLQHSGADHRQPVEPDLRREHHHKRGQGCRHCPAQSALANAFAYRCAPASTASPAGR